MFSDTTVLFGEKSNFIIWYFIIVLNHCKKKEEWISRGIHASAGRRRANKYVPQCGWFEIESRSMINVELKDF